MYMYMYMYSTPPHPLTLTLHLSTHLPPPPHLTLHLSTNFTLHLTPPPSPSTSPPTSLHLITLHLPGFRAAGSIRSYLAVDLAQLHQDALKEQQLLRKLSPGEERPSGQSVLAASLQYGLAIEFERSDHVRRFRLMLSEVLRITSLVGIRISLDQRSR